MAKRRAIPKRLRFEVFERDGFQCKYCGRTAEETTLELDHMHPHSKGGDDSKENLITSCRDCNAGKSAKELDALPEGARLALAQERRELEYALQEKSRIAELRKEEEQFMVNTLCDLVDQEQVPANLVETCLRLEREWGLQVVIDWVKIASRKMWVNNGTNFCKYLNGIARKVRERQGV